MTTNTSLQKISTQFVSLCQAGKAHECVDRFYSDNIESIEPHARPDDSHIVRGMDALRKKHEWWQNSFEVHAQRIEGPWPDGSKRFAVKYALDVTEKGSGKRSQTDEIGLYTVANGKIIREEYFYPQNES